jgi:hypothetical protein
MTAIARLHRRLDKIAGPEKAVVPIPDTSVLSGAQQDRFNELTHRFVNGPASDAETSELLTLFEACPVEGPEGPRKPPIIVPNSLEIYWRLARRHASIRALPPGNYYFHELGLAERERLMGWCKRYGWEPDNDEVNIAPIDEWREDDYLELWALLVSAVTPEEQRYWPKDCSPTKLV